MQKGIYLDKKTNKYYVSTTFTTMDGNYIKKCKRGFNTIREAEKWKAQFTTECLNKTYLQLTSNKNEFEAVFDKFIKYKSSSLKPKSIELYTKFFKKHIFSRFNNKMIKDISVNDLADLYTYLNSLNLLSKTFNQYISYVLSLFEYLDLMEYINPTIYRKSKIILSPKKVDDSKDFNVLSASEFKSFLDTFEDDEISYTHKLLFKVLFFTGCRKGEAFGLDYHSINFYENTITFDKQLQYISGIEVSSNYTHYKKDYYISPFTKTNVKKVVAVPQDLIDEIKQYRINHQDNILLFDLIDMNLLTKVFKNHLKLAGLKDTKIHALRHTHTTMLYEMGCDPKYIAERLGHTTELTSMKTYEHLTKQKEKENNNIVINNLII